MFISNCSIAQSFSWGPVAGLNFSNITESPSSGVTSTNKTGLIAGIKFERKFDSSFSVISKIRYLSSGFKSKSGQYDITWNMEYLDFPILIKYKFNIENVFPYLTAGFSTGFNLSAKLKSSENIVAVEVDFKNSIEKYNFELLFGTGIDINILESKSIFVQIAYSLGLVDINKSNNTSWKTKSIQVTSGLLFNL
ncbi:MAG: PorT family protein [Ignavibacteria bacterium]|nr:PorT family protein [Ignavibacteria bacterium]